MPTDRSGGFEELVLLATARLGGAGCGVTIQEELEAGAGPTDLGRGRLRDSGPA